MDSKLTQLRLIGFIEGISFLVLLFIAMPIKYIGGDPMPVKYVGMTHGILFIGFLYLLYSAWEEYRWTMKFNFFAFICSLVPFGTFWLDKKLKEKEAVLFNK